MDPACVTNVTNVTNGNPLGRNPCGTEATANHNVKLVLLPFFWGWQ